MISRSQPFAIFRHVRISEKNRGLPPYRIWFFTQNISILTRKCVSYLEYGFFTARALLSRYMLYGRVSVRLSVSVCPSQVGVLLKWLNIGTRKQRHTIAQGLYLSDAKHLFEIRTGSPPTGAPNAGGVGRS